MILLLGNCQLHRLFYIMGNNGITSKYVANTERLDPSAKFETVMESVRDADLIIAQPIFNPSNPLNYQILRKEAKEVIFFPYVFLDGLFSLSAADIGSEVIYGREMIESYMHGDLGHLANAFMDGQIDFKNQERFDASLDELQRREQIADMIPIVDVIRENFRARPLLLSHNHPEKWLMDVLCLRLFERMKWSYKTLADCSYRHRVDYVFSPGEAVLSPYDADRLGLRYPADDQWWTVGHRLLSRSWEQHRSQAA